MAVIPIVVEGHPTRVGKGARKPGCLGSNYSPPVISTPARRGSKGHFPYATIRRGSHGKRGSIDYSRRGSMGKRGSIDYSRRVSMGKRGSIDYTRRGSMGKRGSIDYSRRGSMGKRSRGVVQKDSGTVKRRELGTETLTASSRGPCSTTTSRAVSSTPHRKTSIGQKLEENIRRGSLARRGSESKFKSDAALCRRGSSSRFLLAKRGSKSALNNNNYQIKICIEGEEEDNSRGDAAAAAAAAAATNNMVRSVRGQPLVTSNNNNNNKNVSSNITKNRPKESLRKAALPNTIAAAPASRPTSSLTTRPTSSLTTRPIKSAATLGASSCGATKSPGLVSPSVKFVKDSLNSHNKYRARHGAQPLAIDQHLSQLAQEYAQQLANSCTFQHSGDTRYGENLYWAWSSDPNFALQGNEAVDSWYEECLHSYDYSCEPADTQSGHFTQLVWTASERLGVGLARTPTGRHIVVMKYDPPGNFVGRYTQHVKRPVSPEE